MYDSQGGRAEGISALMAMPLGLFHGVLDLWTKRTLEAMARAEEQRQKDLARRAHKR